MIKWLKNNPAMIWLFGFVILALLDGLLIDLIGWCVTDILIMILAVVGIFVAGGVQFNKEIEK